jgi:hydrogenase maturation protease
LSAAEGAPRALAVGVGTDWAGDDAAGLAVVRALAGRLPPSTVAAELHGDPTMLLERWRGVPVVVLVDAVRGCGPPGSLHRFDASREPIPAPAGGGTHSLGFAAAIELGRRLGELPERVVAFGVEGADFAQGGELSPPVAAAIEPAAETVLAELRGGEPVLRSEPEPAPAERRLS